jgi:hypothetical protein
MKPIIVFKVPLTICDTDFLSEINPIKAINPTIIAGSSKKLKIKFNFTPP